MHPTQHSPPPLTVNGLNFHDEVREATVPVLVDVTAAWCGPCRAAEPVLQRLAQAYGPGLKVVRIDGGESPELVAELGVRGFPTFLLFAGGRERGRSAGFQGEARLRGLIEGATAAGPRSKAQ